MELFWASHSPTSRFGSRQYASIIFYHNDEQRQMAVASKERLEAELGQKIYTEIVPYTGFYLAEGYHQKYRLRQVRTLLEEFTGIYPDLEDFVNSTAVTRVNGYVAGHGSMEMLQAEIDSLGLSPEGRQKLLDLVSRYHP